MHSHCSEGGQRRFSLVNRLNSEDCSRRSCSSYRFVLNRDRFQDQLRPTCMKPDLKFFL